MESGWEESMKQYIRDEHQTQMSVDEEGHHKYEDRGYDEEEDRDPLWPDVTVDEEEDELLGAKQFFETCVLGMRGKIPTFRQLVTALQTPDLQQEEMSEPSVIESVIQANAKLAANKEYHYADLLQQAEVDKEENRRLTEENRM